MSPCGALGKPAAGLLLLQQHQRQLVPVLGTWMLQPTPQQPTSTSSPQHPLPGWRWYAADAPEPLIVPSQQRQQQQPGAVATTPEQRKEIAVPLPPANLGPWERVIDKGTGQPYWWNAKTGVTTPVGASKPDAWVAVVETRTQTEYFWNKESGERAGWWLTGRLREVSWNVLLGR